ncbi:MAG: sulfite exporter TauE/SafE family protein [Coriobacteriia bacterium]|nr:sulfite exporter TauE/SafE family protein [Coriobacteriia bacterium]
MDDLVPLLTAIGAGLLTFLSPCVLPLIPGYIAFMSGLSSSELAAEDRKITTVLVPSLLFVLGFSIVFVALGASASAVGSFLMANRKAFEVVAGVIIFVLGFFMLGIVKVPWLYGEARFEMQKARRFGVLAALVMGMAFAFGWSPCVGPILGSILMMAANSAEVGRGALLLGLYSLGMGVPFVLVAVMLGRVKPVLNWLNRRALIINRVAGAILMLLGLLILTGWIAPVVGFLSMFIPKIGG